MVDSAVMTSLYFFNRGIEYLLCVIDVFNKYPWVNPLKDKKAKTFLHGFIKIVNKSNCKPNKLWVDKEKYFIIVLCTNG